MTAAGQQDRHPGRVVFLGPPGSGKGTQGTRLASLWGVPHIASGDRMRQILQEEPDSELAQAIRVIDEGRLVSDETAGRVVFRALAREDACRGFVLDGYPRSVNQARDLERFLAERQNCALDAVIGLVIDEEALVERLSGRLTCPNCGATYHVKSAPPRVAGVCDICGHTLVVREDDRPDRIRTRLHLYRERTEPLMAFYRENGLLHEVNAAGREETVFSRVLGALG